MSRSHLILVLSIAVFLLPATFVCEATPEPEKGQTLSPLPTLSALPAPDVRTPADGQTLPEEPDEAGEALACSAFERAPEGAGTFYPAERRQTTSICRRDQFFGECPSLKDKECWPKCGRNNGYCVLIFNCETQCNCTP